MKKIKTQKDILAKNYIAYQKYITDNEEDPNKLKVMLNLLYGISYEEYNKTPYTKILKYVEEINNYINNNTKLIINFKINNIKYGINPNFADITMGEMLDLDTEDIMKQIAILYRPVIKERRKKYLIKEYTGEYDLELFNNNITLDIFLGFIGFFLKINEDYLSYTQNYLEKEVASNPELKNSLRKNGGGFRGFTG